MQNRRKLVLYAVVILLLSGNLAVAELKDKITLKLPFGEGAIGGSAQTPEPARQIVLGLAMLLAGLAAFIRDVNACAPPSGGAGKHLARRVALPGLFIPPSHRAEAY